MIVRNWFIKKFHSSAIVCIKKHEFPPRYKVPETEIEEKFIKGGGKGGQKINKTNSKVQLKHIPTGIVVNSQFSRSREDNRKRAREILGGKIDDLKNGENSRNAIIARYYLHKAQKKKQRANKLKRVDNEEGSELQNELQNELQSEPLMRPLNELKTGLHDVLLQPMPQKEPQTKT